MSRFAVIEADYSYWLSRLNRDFDVALAEMFLVVSAVEGGTYSANAASVALGHGTEVLQDILAIQELAVKNAARSCFLIAIGRFISYLDQLIAAFSTSQKPVIIDRDLESEEEIIAYFSEYLLARVSATARDTKLTNPKKVKFFELLSPELAAFAVKMFELRRILEHHHDRTGEALEVCIRRRALAIEGREIVSFPHLVKKGETAQMVFVRETKRFETGLVVLHPNDVVAFVFNMRLAANEIFQAYFSPAPPNDSLNQVTT